MFALFLLFFIFGIYIWLAYKPQHTSDQQRYEKAATVSVIQETKTATDIIKQSPLGTEPIVNIEQSAGPDMPGPSGRSIRVEEIAPEVELALPAEPRGPGDPIDRQNPPPPPEAMEAVPIAIPQANSSPYFRARACLRR